MKRSAETSSYSSLKRQKPLTFQESLEELGYVTVKVDIGKLSKIRASIDQEISNFREFKQDAKNRFQLGGFSAYGNPSSFHNKTVRDLRLEIFNQISPSLEKEGFKKELLIDRLMVRPAGKTPSAESWHRDEAATAKDGDLIFGGWVNLDDFPSSFVCVPGSHKGVTGHNGFSKFNKEDSEKFKQLKKTVKIPPGHVLIFNEKIVHCVCAKKNKYDSYRLFLGWRLTKELKPLFSNIFEQIDKQAPITIKSGQSPPMWAKLHWTNWVDTLEEHSKKFKQECLEKATVKSGKNKGRVVERVHVNMRGLKEYGFELYPQYTEAEKRVLVPH